MKNNNLPLSKEEIDNIIEKIKSYIYSFEKVECLVLFGSFARGDYSLRHSDLDLYIIFNCEKNFEIERQIYREINSFSDKIQIHLSFEFKPLTNDGKFLRYNILKEGIILFSKSNSLFLKEDLGLIEVYLIEMDLKNLKTYERTNLKRSMKNRFKNYVLDIDGSRIIIKKDFLEKFNSISKKKKLSYKILFEFLYHSKEE